MRCLDSGRFVGVLAVLAGSVAGAQGLRISAVDVGQGDSMVVVAPGGCAALFDGGPTGSGGAIKATLASLGVTHIDLAFTSHFHADHLGGLDEVDVGAGAIPITAVYDRGGTYSSSAFTSYASHFAGRRFTATVGQTFSLCGEVTLRVVAVNANGATTSDENALSLVVKVSWGAFDALIGGDLTGSSPDVESTIAADVGEVELYKVHHHGSKTSSNATLLAQLQPTVSFISVGANNSYGHPTPECLGRLAAVGSVVWQTEDPATGTVRGDIDLTSADGTAFTVQQGANSASYTSKGVSADTSPPSAPGALTATAVSASEIDLDWSVSSDNVGVTGYRIHRSSDGVDFSLVGTSSVNGFADLGLPAGTPFFYRVTAVDAAGNESPPSETAQATTQSPDVTPPTPPPGLTATASSATQVDLTWAPASDDVGVTGYRVYRSTDGVTFALAAQTSLTAHSDTGLSPSTTVWYRVTALDAAGHESVASITSATTFSASLTVTAPNGSEQWAGGSVHDITWTSNGVSTVRVEYSSNGGASYTVVTTGVPASSGRYAWTLPTAGTTQGRVRVTGELEGVADVSDANFVITAAGPGQVILNEVLANEPGANTSQEFIEVVNVGGQPVNLASWQLRVGGSTRHTFAAGTTLEPGKALVVFASASAIPPELTNALAASSGSLGLPNSGSTVQLRDSNRRTIDSVKYSSSLAAVDGVSMNRNPDATAGAPFVLHTTLSAASASPGVRASGATY